MKKIFIVVLGIVVATGCTKEEDFVPANQEVSQELKIQTSTGIKVQNPFVTTEVAMNVKSEIAGTATIKIFDISNRVVSKETVSVNVGDNILKVYTSALPSSAYRIGLFDSNNNMSAITDFNKI
jgi:hypothetical protein